MSPEGDRLHVSGGQVLSTGSFDLVAEISNGVPRYGDRDDIVYVALGGSLVWVYETATFTRIDEFRLPCEDVLSNEGLQQFLVLPGERGILALGRSALCGVIRQPACSPPMSAAAPRNRPMAWWM